VGVALARGQGETDAVEPLRTAQGDFAWFVLVGGGAGEGVEVVEPGSTLLAGSIDLW
jgi:hypothetical protein